MLQWTSYTIDTGSWPSGSMRRNAATDYVGALSLDAASSYPVETLLTLPSYIITSAKEVMFLPDFVCLSVCLSVCQQDNSKSYGRIFLKAWGYVGHGTNYQWFNFGGDPAGILDFGSVWNFRYHCVKEGIREPLAKWIWWRHLANNIALAEIPASYDCFLVYIMSNLTWQLVCFP